MAELTQGNAPQAEAIAPIDQAGTEILNKGKTLVEGVKDNAENGFSGTANVMKVSDCDIYQNYRWGINNNNKLFRSEVPNIILTEYQPNSGPILESLDYAFKIGSAAFKSGKKIDGYQKIYSGVFTGNKFELPFFASYNHQIGSTWSDGNNFNAINSAFTGIENAMSIFNRGVIEKRRNWQGTSQTRYPFSFTLYNTFSQDDILKNFNFIRALVHNNLPSRTGFATMLPPCFYAIEIPGVRYTPVAALESINIENIGQVNRRAVVIDNESINMNIPDAWKIDISVHELHTESREIYDGTFTNTNKVTIVDAKELSDQRKVVSVNRNASKIIGQY